MRVRRWFELPLRALLVGALVGSTLTVSALIGPAWTGIAMAFPITLTSSVAIAGVLLVFSFLIVPSVASMLFSQRLGVRLAIGWTMGAIVSAVGVYLSFLFDLPTGAAIVATFGAALLILGAVRKLLPADAMQDS